MNTKQLKQKTKALSEALMSAAINAKWVKCNPPGYLTYFDDETDDIVTNFTEEPGLRPGMLLRLRDLEGNERVHLVGSINEAGGQCDCCSDLPTNDRVVAYVMLQDLLDLLEKENGKA